MEWGIFTGQTKQKRSMYATRNSIKFNIKMRVLWMAIVRADDTKIWIKIWMFGFSLFDITNATRLPKSKRRLMKKMISNRRLCDHRPSSVYSLCQRDNCNKFHPFISMWWSLSLGFIIFRFDLCDNGCDDLWRSDFFYFSFVLVSLFSLVFLVLLILFWYTHRENNIRKLVNQASAVDVSK